MRIASVVIEEGGKPAQSLCAAKQTVTEVEGMERSCGKEGSSWQVMEYLRKRTISARNVRVVHSQKGMDKKERIADAAQEKQQGIQCQWQQESPNKDVLEQVTRNADTDCNAQTMRRAYNAQKSGNWEGFKEEFRKEGKLCEWTFQRLQEAYDKVALEDIDRLSIAKENLRKSTDRAPIDGMEGVTLSYVCPHCSCIPLDNYVWWVLTGHGDGNKRKKEALQLVVCSMWRPLRMESANRILVVQIGANEDRAKVFKVHAAPLGCVTI